MHTKSFTFTLCVVAVFGSDISEWQKYPAGVSPHLCPDYPHCDNAVLGAYAKAAGDVALAYSARAHAAPTYLAYGHGHAVPVAKGYPAWVHPKTCPNYPFCGPTPVHVPTKVWKSSYGHASDVPVAKGYPAGVHPITCPNYPFCGPTPAHVPSKFWTTSIRYADAAPELFAWAPSTDASYGKGPIW